jgi:two-component system, OmpR family, sensor histidine kinase MprB
VTFRSRVILATVLAAALALIVACSASFFATKNALLSSVDSSLLQQAHHPLNPNHEVDDSSQFTGSFVEIVLANGTAIPQSSVPIDSVITNLAQGKGQLVLRTVLIDNQDFRELVIPLPANSIIDAPGGSYIVHTTSAELFVVDITGQVNELRRLIVTLIAVALGGLLLALLLGIFLARQALRPLVEVTNQIETIALNQDMSHRLQEKGVDELGRLRRVFNRLLGTVEASQLLQRQLVMDASHELRTPLTSLRTNAQILSRHNQLNEEDMAQITTDVVAQVDELAALVGDLGELARGERSEGEVIELRLDECVEELIDTARTYARIKNITIEADLQTSRIMGRRDRLDRAVSNLLTNAIKFTPEGGHIRVTCAGGRITVSDSGPGVSEEDRPFVFDRFWRSSTARALPGSGLGLSIVAQVAGEMSATVSVGSDEALGGAKFTIAIPEIA